MARRFDLIVFDWDGTLLDSPAAIVESIRAACVDLGMQPPSEERARFVIGLGLRDAMQHALPDLDPRDYPRLAERYRHHYLSRDETLQLFEGADELLRDLRGRGYRLGIATGKTRLGLDRALRFAGVGGLFDASRCADECRPKPAPEMLHELMQATGVAPGRALMIGDTVHDLRMARDAGIAGLGVTFGAHTRQALMAETPLDCVDTFFELTRWLSSNA